MARQFPLHAGATRCAVVIGVDFPGGTDLKPLMSAAAGAEDVAVWLDQEGYDIALFTDQDSAKVLPGEINAALTAFIDRQTYELLVLYFSGHGYFKNLTDYWVLSGAPDDANAAVLFEAAERAKNSGFKNVIIVSDACRSKPTGVATDIRGSTIFPNRQILPEQRGTVDQIMSTTPDTVAYEADLLGTGKRISVLTHCLRLAFEQPDRAMISDVTVDGATLKVVTNRTLRKVIPKAVQQALKAAKVKGTQWPELIIPSDDDVFIAKARMRPASTSPGKAELISSAHPFLIGAARALTDPGTIARELNLMAQRLKAADLTAREVEGFETHTGIAVIGASIRDALAERGARTEMAERVVDGKRSLVLRCFPLADGAQADTGAHNVAIRFDNGRGAVIAALYGFVAHVAVENEGIVNIRYVPSSNNSRRYREFLVNQALVDKWHAESASMARDGVLDLQRWPDAVKAAEEIRVWKGLDPSLGVYASYFYALAGPKYYDSAADVMSIMAWDMGVALFDPALLGDKLSSTGRTTLGATEKDRIFQVYPACPMLTQGWHFLRSRGVRLPEVLNDGQDELAATLWTTFKARRMDRIFDAFKNGDFS